MLHAQHILMANVFEIVKFSINYQSTIIVINKTNVICLQQSCRDFGYLQMSVPSSSKFTDSLLVTDAITHNIFMVVSVKHMRTIFIYQHRACTCLIEV